MLDNAKGMPLVPEAASGAPREQFWLYFGCPEKVAELIWVQFRNQFSVFSSGSALGVLLEDVWCVLETPMQ